MKRLKNEIKTCKQHFEGLVKITFLVSDGSVKNKIIINAFMLDQMEFNVKKVGSTVDILDQNGIFMNITNEQLTLSLTENLETNSRYVIEGTFLRNFFSI